MGVRCNIGHIDATTNRLDVVLRRQGLRSLHFRRVVIGDRHLTTRLAGVRFSKIGHVGILAAVGGFACCVAANVEETRRWGWRQ